MTPGQRAWAIRLGAIALAQLLFWFGVRPLLLRRPEPPPLAPVTAVQVARIPTTAEAAREATPETVRAMLPRLAFDSTTVPWTGCCEPAQYVVRFTVPLADVPTEGLGVLARLDADNAWLFVNGTFAAGTGRLDVARPSRLRLRSAWFTPATLWQAGENTVELVTVSRTIPYIDVLAPWIAPWPALNAAITWREWVFREYAWVSIALTSALALLGFTLWARGGHAPALWWPSVLLTAWTGRTLLGQDVAAALPPDWRVPTVFATELVLALAWFGIADTWVGTASPRWRRALSGVAALAWIVALVMLHRDVPAPQGFDAASTLHNWAGLFFVALALLRVVPPLVRAPAPENEGRAAEAAVLSVLMTLLGLDFWREVTSQQVGGYLASSLPLLFVAFAVAFAARNVRLFRSTNEINQLLGARLAEREAELAQSFAARQEVTRQQALYEERSRIMRDMHDGIGGRLLSLVA